MSLADKLMALLPQLTAADFVPGGTVVLQDDGSGPYIAKWGRAEPQPTPEQIAAAQPRAVVPEEVTAFQARAALLGAGLLAQVETAIAQASPVAKLAWDHALTFKRTSPTVLAMAQALGLSDAQLDALFTAAAGIEA